MFNLGNKGPVVGKASVLINAPPEAVFRYVGVDFFQNYAKWSPEVLQLEALTQGPVGVGTEARQVRVDQGHKTESRFRVTAFDLNRKLCFEGVSDPYRCVYEVQPIEGGHGTALYFTFELSELKPFMRPFEKLIRSVIQEGAERTTRNLKRLIESR